MTASSAMPMAGTGQSVHRKTLSKAAKAVVKKGFHALKLDPFGAARGFIDTAELERSYDILHAIRKEFGPELKILIDVHARFTPTEAIRNCPADGRY